MEQIKTRLRHELKYYINNFEYYALKSRLCRFLKRDDYSDENCEYHIRSLYFDSIYNQSLFEKQSGSERREKLRIRIYNKSDNLIKLEKKYKVGQLTGKQVSVINRQEAERIISGDIENLCYSGDVLLRDFYMESRNNLLRPAVIVDYTREAYVHPAGNVRITFDKKLMTGLNSTDIFNRSIPVINALDEPLMIMEIKYDEFLPGYIGEIIQTCSKQRSAISKYAICRKFNKDNNWEDN